MYQPFITTSRGLNRNLPPLRLFEKAKRYGTWNPAEIDFTQDIDDWSRLKAEEQDLILRLTALFQAGEEAVTLDLLPLMMVIAREGRLEEEMFLTTFLFEEAKHTDFFHRFLEEVADNPQDLSRYHTASYGKIFSEALPNNLEALLTDSSPAAQVRASTTYNMIVEGMLAETGYHAYFTALARNDIMPGTRRGVELLKQDESRHIAYGVYLLSRLIAKDESLFSIVEETMNQLVVPALGVITDAFACYDVIPFGLVEEDFTSYAMSQFQKRMDRIEKSRGATLDDINRVTHNVIEENDS